MSTLDARMGMLNASHVLTLERRPQVKIRADSAVAVNAIHDAGSRGMLVVHRLASRAAASGAAPMVMMTSRPAIRRTFHHMKSTLILVAFRGVMDFPD